MWPILMAMLLDTTTVRHIGVAPAETLTVTITGIGRPIVMVPGVFGSAFAFRKVVPDLADAGYQVIVVEPLAYGTSSRPRRADYTLHAQALRVARILDALDVHDAVLVGHSLGAAIVLRLAWMRPQLARAVLSLEGGPAEAAAGPGMRRALTMVPLVRLIGGRSIIRRALRQSLVRSSGNAGWADDETLLGYTAGITADLDATLLAYMRMADARESEPLAAHLAEIACPVQLLLGGARHDAGPGDDEIARLRRFTPHLDVVTVAGAGHYLQEEQPDAVVRAILAMATSTVTALATP